MTKQEVKEEMRRMDGDPKIKQRRRQIAIQTLDAAAEEGRAQGRCGRDQSDGVCGCAEIRLRHDARPARRRQGPGLSWPCSIREIAIEHGVPILERKPLARALYKLVDVGQEIPEQFYSAVAEILAYVYELSGKSKQKAG